MTLAFIGISNSPSTFVPVFTLAFALVLTSVLVPVFTCILISTFAPVFTSTCVLVLTW